MLILLFYMKNKNKSAIQLLCYRIFTIIVNILCLLQEIYKRKW